MGYIVTPFPPFPLLFTATNLNALCIGIKPALVTVQGNPIHMLHDAGANTVTVHSGLTVPR